jgi:hypothetical protein
MQVSIAVYTFVATIFVIFVLWGTKNLGLLGLMSTFSIGMITYSFTSSLEISVAAIILSGILLNLLYPYIQHRWVEKYTNPDPKVLGEQIQKWQQAYQGGKPLPASGQAPVLLEGFQNEPTTARGRNVAAGAAGTGAAGIGVAGTGAAAGTGVGAAGVGTAGVGTAGVGAAAGTGAGAAVGAAGAMTSSMPAIVAPGTMAASLTTAPMAQQGAQTVMLPNINGSGATAIKTQPMAPVADMSAVQAAAMTGSEPASVGTAPQAQSTLNASGSPAAPSENVETVGTIPTVGQTAQPEVSAFMNPGQAGMFKLGELPSATANGPHIDAGTTIMRALGALNPDQIGSLTDDTRKLLDTQKSLMNMLSTMKPMLSDGQNLLASFTNMFGKQ